MPTFTATEYALELMPVRIQFTCYRTLVAEVIVQGTREADRIMAAFPRAKDRKNKPLGGCCQSRADVERLWNVPVGAVIPHQE